MQKIAILYDASQIVLSTFNLDEVLDRILSTVRDYFHMQNGAILLFDRAAQEFYVKTSFGHDLETTNLRVPMGAGIVGSAAQLKRAIYVPDVSKDQRYFETFANTRSELAIPLIVREAVVGVLDFQSEKINGFDRETIDLLTLFSTQASIAIQNAELYTREQRRAAQLEAINAISMETRSVLELEKLLPQVCTLVRKYFSADHVAILLLERPKLVIRAHAGVLTPVLDTGWQLPFGEGLSSKALADKKTVLANDVTAAGGYVHGFREVKAELCVPLVSFGERIGVLVLDNANHPFSADDVPALESVADICAAAIQNAHSFAMAQRMADLDGLTGVFNRRHLEKRLVAEIERLGRYEHSMALLLADLDHFKRINDEFGHMLGDEVLRQAAALMRDHLRKADVVCRYGGEEFAILLPETKGEAARAVAEKLRRRIADHSFPGVARPVTVSIGVADFPEQGSTRDELVRAADEALYAAKQAGRNRVTLWSEMGKGGELKDEDENREAISDKQ